jgi:hypothetical protein
VRERDRLVRERIARPIAFAGFWRRKAFTTTIRSPAIGAPCWRR